MIKIAIQKKSTKEIEMSPTTSIQTTFDHFFVIGITS